LPSVIIKGATYNEVLQAFTSLSISIGDINYAYHWSDEEFRSKIQLLRDRLPKAEITHYTFNAYGMTSKVDPNGQPTFYEYDDLDRLKLIKDFEGNILKSYTYQYK
jgi:YD repeat-containing protein